MTVKERIMHKKVFFFRTGKELDENSLLFLLFSACFFSLKIKVYLIFMSIRVTLFHYKLKVFIYEGKKMGRAENIRSGM